MNCIICDGETQQHFTGVYSCLDCKHLYRKFTHDMSEYHRTEYRKTHPINLSRLEKINNLRMEIIRPYITAGQRTLDVGCSVGYFGDKLLEHFDASYTGLEIDPNLVAQAQAKGLDVRTADFLTAEFDEVYDTVFMWHVLEHFDDVRTVMSALERLTSNQIIIEVPLLKHIKVRSRVRDIRPLTASDGHYHYFTEKSFRTLIEDEYPGLEIVELKDGVQAPAMFVVLRRKQ